MLNIIEEFERQGLDPAASSLRIGIFGAEPWGQGMRDEIEQRAGLDAVDIYGLSEVMGPGVANECIETKDGPVIWEDHFYPEIIHPVTGEVMPEGEAGELVFTSLTKEAMPVIRYRTRDLTRLLPPTARAMRRMDKIAGRSDDMMIIRGVNVFPSQIEELLFQQPALAPHYQILLTRNLHLDQMEVLVETREEVRHGDGVRGGAQLEQMIKSYIGISCTVTVLPPNVVERTQVGKARRVVDKRVQSV
jgi:phenylacetate-CoA ligase